MNDLKKIINKNLIEPAANSRSSNIFIAEIINTNELNNTCKVKFQDNRGNISRADNVIVLTYNKSIIDWFPSKGDKVIVQKRQGRMHVTGPAELDYQSLRRQVELKNDIYTESFISGYGGYII